MRGRGHRDLGQRDTGKAREYHRTPWRPKPSSSRDRPRRSSSPCNDHRRRPHHNSTRGGGGDGGGGHDVPPKYMLPDHPSDLGQPYSWAGKKESDFLGDVGPPSLPRQKPLFLDDGPRTFYDPLPPAETGFLTGAPSVQADSAFGSGSLRAGAIHDGDVLLYHEHSRDPYVDVERERLLYSGRDVSYPDMPPSSHPRAVAGASLTKDRIYASHGEHLHEPANAFAINGLSRFSEESLGHAGSHTEMILPETVRRLPPVQPYRGTSMDYGVREYGRRDMEKDMHLASEDMYENVSRGSRANIRDSLGSSSFASRQDERIDHRAGVARRMPEEESSFYDMHHQMHPPFHGGTAQYWEGKGVRGDYTQASGSEHVGLTGRPVHRHGVASIEDGYDLGGPDVWHVYRGRSESPAYQDREMFTYRTEVSPPGREYYEDDMDEYELTPERLSGRDYVMVDDGNRFDARNTVPSDRNVFSRIALPRTVDEEWAYEDRGNHLHSSRSVYGRSKHNMISHRLSRPSTWSQHGNSFMHQRGGGAKNAKKRLRPDLPQNHGVHTSERNELSRPHKYSKRSEDKHDSPDANHEDTPKDEDLLVKKDPPEGSDEFKLQVHRFFLKFSKTLNESLNMQKRYREAPKGSLFCCVCGSTKKFPDIDALISHTYDTCKVGLKTKHLGLHKALCMLMGWNWRVPPDTSKAYHSISAEEANALKDDLILWPPVVIIHNSSIANNATAHEAKIVTTEEVESVLRGIGVPALKPKICHGIPANQSVFLVKFQPTFSGLQEARKIHEHFAGRRHGKEEFQQIKGGGEAKKHASVEKVDDLLYGHIAIAEDLVYLNDDTKRRCLVKSKKDIEAVADAPLQFDS